MKHNHEDSCTLGFHDALVADVWCRLLSLARCRPFAIEKLLRLRPFLTSQVHASLQRVTVEHIIDNGWWGWLMPVYFDSANVKGTLERLWPFCNRLPLLQVICERYPEQTAFIDKSALLAACSENLELLDFLFKDLRRVPHPWCIQQVFVEMVGTFMPRYFLDTYGIRPTKDIFLYMIEKARNPVAKCLTWFAPLGMERRVVILAQCILYTVSSFNRFSIELPEKGDPVNMTSRELRICNALLSVPFNLATNLGWFPNAVEIYSTDEVGRWELLAYLREVFHALPNNVYSEAILHECILMKDLPGVKFMVDHFDYDRHYIEAFMDDAREHPPTASYLVDHFELEEWER